MDSLLGDWRSEPDVEAAVSRIVAAESLAADRFGCIFLINSSKNNCFQMHILMNKINRRLALFLALGRLVVQLTLGWQTGFNALLCQPVPALAKMLAKHMRWPKCSLDVCSTRRPWSLEG